MKLLILVLLSPAVVLSSQRLRKSADPNDEPFLPIHPQYPYSPKLIKRGLEQSQAHQHQPQAIPTQLGADSYAASFAQGGASPASYYSSSALEALAKSSPSALGAPGSPFYSSPSSSYPASPYSSLLGSYPGPYGSSPAAPSFGLGAGLGVSPYAGPGAPGAYPPNYYYPPSPYYYPGYYGQPPYPGPPPGYPYKHGDEDDEEDDRRREKGRKSSHKNKLRNSDRDNQYVDGANYIISSAKDLDSESSTHRTPSHLNQIDDSDVVPRAVILPKATYRLVSVSGQPDNSAGSNGYIKVQQLEQLMRQALAKLLAQNAAQQASLAQIQQEASNLQGKDASAQQYIAVPNTIAKTGLSYVVNPTILNRVTPGQYSPSTLIQTIGNKPYVQKTSGTSVTLQQSPGIYIPPTKSTETQDYGDYDSGDSNATTRPVEPTRNYAYSTYRPTQQTNLDDVNFGNKQKNKT